MESLTEAESSGFDLEKQKLIKPEQSPTFPLSIAYPSADVKWQGRSWKTRPKPPPKPKPLKTSTVLFIVGVLCAILIAMIILAVVFEQCNYKCIFIYLNGSQLTKMRVFLTLCPCHEIRRDEAVGLRNAIVLEKLRFLWKCGIRGNIVKIWYFVNNCLIEVRI